MTKTAQAPAPAQKPYVLTYKGTPVQFDDKINRGPGYPFCTKELMTKLQKEVLTDFFTQIAPKDQVTPETYRDEMFRLYTVLVKENSTKEWDSYPRMQAVVDWMEILHKKFQWRFSSDKRCATLIIEFKGCRAITCESFEDAQGIVVLGSAGEEYKIGLEMKFGLNSKEYICLIHDQA